jgi:class 3 adenylate cyclase/CheY-like chemotaxis protein
MAESLPVPEAQGAKPKSLRHQLRTPLNQIIGYGEMLQEEARDNAHEQYLADLQKIGIAARNLLELIDKHVDPNATDAAPGAAPPPATAAAPATAPRTPVAPPPTTLPPAATATPGGARLLVVDDNEMNRDMLSRRLRKQGYEVATAEDGYRALDVIAAEPFDLVLLDIMMPGISGLEVLEKLREQHSVADLPIIMATAKDQSEDTVQALGLGANDYVTKPIDFPVVIARVKTQLSLKRAMEEVRRLVGELDRRNQFIRKTFGRYLSDDIVADLLETPDGLALGGEKRLVTVLMSDLRGFTATSERLAPEQVVRALNRYLGTMAEIITRHRGTIDEFIGDAVLALFGAPHQRGDDAARALACAIEMQLAMVAVNEANRAEGLPALQMGIAVNTGEVVVGNIGSETRAKYGVVGSPVNQTARIESCTLGGQVFVSETTLAKVGAEALVGPRMTVDAKGCSEPLAFHNLRGLQGGYNLSLPERHVHLTPLADAIPASFTVVEGKHNRDEQYNAHFTRLNTASAEVAADLVPDPLTNLRLRVTTLAGRLLPGDLYAKVVECHTDGHFIVGFTAVPPEVAAYFGELLKSQHH